MTAGAYFAGILTLSAGFSLLVRLLPEGSGGSGDGLRKSLYRGVSLALTLCLLAPAVPLVKRIGESAFHGTAEYLPSSAGSADLSGLYSAMSEVSAGEIGKYLESALSEKFGISPENVRVDVSVTSDAEGVRLTFTNVTLYGTAVLTDPHAVISYTEKLTGSPADVYCSVGIFD